MPHRSQQYVERCTKVVRVTRTEKKWVPKDLDHPYWDVGPGWDFFNEAPEFVPGPDTMEIDVDVPVLDENGEEVFERCPAAATTECARCRVPFCEAHAPAQDQRCGECEREFERREPVSIVLALAPVIAVVVGVIHLWIDWKRALLFLAYPFAQRLVRRGIRPWKMKRKRRRFLSERAQRSGP